MQETISDQTNGLPREATVTVQGATIRSVIHFHSEWRAEEVADVIQAELPESSVTIEYDNTELPF